MSDAKLGSGVSSDATTESYLPEDPQCTCKNGNAVRGNLCAVCCDFWSTPRAAANVDRNGIGGGRTRSGGARGQ